MDPESEDDILQRNIDQLDRETPRCNLSEEEEDNAVEKQQNLQTRNIWLKYGSVAGPSPPVSKSGGPSPLANGSDAAEGQLASPYLRRANFSEGTDGRLCHGPTAISSSGPQYGVNGSLVRSSPGVKVDTSESRDSVAKRMPVAPTDATTGSSAGPNNVKAGNAAVHPRGSQQSNTVHVQQGIPLQRSMTHHGKVTDPSNARPELPDVRQVQSQDGSVPSSVHYVQTATNTLSKRSAPPYNQPNVTQYQAKDGIMPGVGNKAPTYTSSLQTGGIPVSQQQPYKTLRNPAMSDMSQVRGITGCGATAASSPSMSRARTAPPKTQPPQFAHQGREPNNRQQTGRALHGPDISSGLHQMHLLRLPNQRMPPHALPPSSTVGMRPPLHGIGKPVPAVSAANQPETTNHMPPPPPHLFENGPRFAPPVHGTRPPLPHHPTGARIASHQRKISPASHGSPRNLQGRGEQAFLPRAPGSYNQCYTAAYLPVPAGDSYHPCLYNEGLDKTVYPPGMYNSCCQDPSCPDCAPPETGNRANPQASGSPFLKSSDEILLKSRELDMCWPEEDMDCVRDFTFADRHKEMTYAERSEEGIYQRATEEVIRQPPPWHDEETDSVKNYSERKGETCTEQQSKTASQEDVCLSPPWNDQEESTISNRGIPLKASSPKATKETTQATNGTSSLASKKKQAIAPPESCYNYIKDETDSVRNYASVPSQLEQTSRIPSCENIPLTPPWTDENGSGSIDTPSLVSFKQLPAPHPPQKTEGLVTKNVDTFESRDEPRAGNPGKPPLDPVSDRGRLCPVLPSLDYDGEDSVRDFSLQGAMQQELSSKMPSYENINFTPPWSSENNSGVQTPCCRHASLTQLPVICEKEAPLATDESPPERSATDAMNREDTEDSAEQQIMSNFRSPIHYVTTYGYQGTGFTPEDSLKDFSLAIQEQTSRIPSSEHMCFTPPWEGSVESTEQKPSDVTTSRQELTLEEQRIIETEVRITGIGEAEQKARLLREEMTQTTGAAGEHGHLPKTVGKDSGFCSEQDKKQISLDGQQLEDSEQTDVQVDPVVQKAVYPKVVTQQCPNAQATTVTTTTTTSVAGARKNSWSSGNSTGSNHTDISTVVNAPTSVPITAQGSPEPASEVEELSDIEEYPVAGMHGKGMPVVPGASSAVPAELIPPGSGIPQGPGAVRGASVKGSVPNPSYPQVMGSFEEGNSGLPSKGLCDPASLSMGRMPAYLRDSKGLHRQADSVNPPQLQGKPQHLVNHMQAGQGARYGTYHGHQGYVHGHPHLYAYRGVANANHQWYYSYDQPRPPPYDSCCAPTVHGQVDHTLLGFGDKSGVSKANAPLPMGPRPDAKMVALEDTGLNGSGDNEKGKSAVVSEPLQNGLEQKGLRVEEPPDYYRLYPGDGVAMEAKKMVEDRIAKPESGPVHRQHFMTSNSSMIPHLQSPPRAETIDTASVVSFASMAASHQNLDSRADMVSSLLSMLGTHDKDDMARTLLAMSHSPDSCAAMRQSGCVPLLTQLLHDPDYETKGINWEARRSAALALHNIVTLGANDRRNRREVRVLRLLEIVRLHSESVLSGKMENYRSFRGAPSLREHGPGPAVAALMKLTFEEEHKNTICELGGVQAIAELLAVDYKVNGHCHDMYTITLRKYAGMALINTTYSDNKSKTVLCTMKCAIQAIIAQLRHTDEEDLIQVSAGILRNTSWRADDHSKQQLSELGAIRALMESTQRLKTEAAIRSVLSAVWNLSAHSSTNKEEICATPGSLQFLCFALNYRSPSKSLAVTENAGGILRNISSHVAVKPEYRKILREQGALQVLISHLRSPSTRVVSNSCGILWNLSARCIQDQELLWELGAVSMLKTLINSKHKSISASSAAALRNLMAVKPGSSGTDTESHASTYFRRIHSLPSRQKPQQSAHVQNMRKDKKYKSLSKKSREGELPFCNEEASTLPRREADKPGINVGSKVKGTAQSGETSKLHRRAGRETGRQFYNDIYRDPPIRSHMCPNKVNATSALYAADNSDLESVESSIGDTTMESKEGNDVAEERPTIANENVRQPAGKQMLGRGFDVRRAELARQGRPQLVTSLSNVVPSPQAPDEPGFRKSHMPTTVQFSYPLGALGGDNRIQEVHVNTNHGQGHSQYPVDPIAENANPASAHELSKKSNLRAIAHAAPKDKRADHYQEPQLMQDFKKLRVRRDSSSSNSSFSPENLPGHRYGGEVHGTYNVAVGHEEQLNRHRRSLSDSFSEYATGHLGHGAYAHYYVGERPKFLKRRPSQLHTDTITDSEMASHERTDGGDRRRACDDEKMFTDSELSRSSYGNFLRNSYSRYEKKVADFKQQQAIQDRTRSGSALFGTAMSSTIPSKSEVQKAKEPVLTSGETGLKSHHLVTTSDTVKKEEQSRGKKTTEQRNGSSVSHISPLCVENVRQHDHRMAREFFQPGTRKFLGGAGMGRPTYIPDIASRVEESGSLLAPDQSRLLTLFKDSHLSGAYDKPLRLDSVAHAADSTPPRCMAKLSRYDVKQAITRKSSETVYSSVRSSNEDVFRPCEHFPGRPSGFLQCDICCQNNIWVRGGTMVDFPVSEFQPLTNDGIGEQLPYKSASSLNLNMESGERPIELSDLSEGLADRLGFTRPMKDVARSYAVDPSSGLLYPPVYKTCGEPKACSMDNGLPPEFCQAMPRVGALDGRSDLVDTIRSGQGVRDIPKERVQYPASGDERSQVQGTKGVKGPKGRHWLLKKMSKDKDGKKRKEKKGSKGKGDFQVTSL